MISILMPTCREKGCHRAIRSIRDTAEGDVEIILSFHPDEKFDAPADKIHISTSWPSKRVYEMEPLASGDLMAMGADDLVYRTKGWDSIFKEYAKKHPIGCFYPYDGAGGTQCFVTRRFYEIAGHFPPYFDHFFADTWVVEVAKMAGCLHFVPEVLIEHMHPKHKKGERDKFYDRRPPPDRKKWESTESERIELARRLRTALECSTA